MKVNKQLTWLSKPYYRILYIRIVFRTHRKIVDLRCRFCFWKRRLRKVAGLVWGGHRPWLWDPDNTSPCNIRHPGAVSLRIFHFPRLAAPCIVAKRENCHLSFKTTKTKISLRLYDNDLRKAETRRREKVTTIVKICFCHTYSRSN